MFLFYTTLNIGRSKHSLRLSRQAHQGKIDTSKALGYILQQTDFFLILAMTNMP